MLRAAEAEHGEDRGRAGPLAKRQSPRRLSQAMRLSANDPDEPFFGRKPLTQAPLHAVPAAGRRKKRPAHGSLAAQDCRQGRRPADKTAPACGANGLPSPPRKFFIKMCKKGLLLCLKPDIILVATV